MPACRGVSPAGLPDEYRAQIERELALIHRLEYEAYFLTVADIVAWARTQKILCQGRGSAANSLVCYCLGVTEVNPADAKLLFERFISAERAEPPDIDIDFEHQRREEVIKYIYGKYGRHRAALTAVVISYRPRSAVRDVGRALGIDLNSASTRSPRASIGSTAARSLRSACARTASTPQAPVVRQWIELTQQLIGFPRHLSQHPGGFVIARERIEDLVPVGKRRDGGPRRRAVGQGRPRRAAAHQGRHPRARHAERDPPRARVRRRQAGPR